MRLIGITYLLMFVILARFASAADVTNADCRAERIAPITLSSKIQKDILRLTASGSPCIKGSIVVTIAKTNGKEIYKETLKTENLYIDPVGVPTSDIDKVLDRIIRDGSMTTGSWPPYVDKPQPIEVEGEYTYSVSKKEYDSLRKKNLPAFRLWLYSEVFTNLIYDDKNDSAVRIWEWGL